MDLQWFCTESETFSKFQCKLEVKEMGITLSVLNKLRVIDWLILVFSDD